MVAIALNIAGKSKSKKVVSSMKKILFLSLIFTFGMLNLHSADTKYRLRGQIIQGTTTYWLMQQAQKWEATREVESPTGTKTYSYTRGDTFASADAFYAVITSTAYWSNSQTINYK